MSDKVLVINGHAIHATGKTVNMGSAGRQPEFHSYCCDMESTRGWFEVRTGCGAAPDGTLDGMPADQWYEAMYLLD